MFFRGNEVKTKPFQTHRYGGVVDEDIGRNAFLAHLGKKVWYLSPGPSEPDGLHEVQVVLLSSDDGASPRCIGGDAFLSRVY